MSDWDIVDNVDWKIDETKKFEVFIDGDVRGEFDTHEQAEAFVSGWLANVAKASPEQPTQPSTETMISEDEGTPAPLPVEPMADLSGAADEILATNGVYDVGDRTYAFGAEISNGSAETE
jgi:hypothetical protein